MTITESAPTPSAPTHPLPAGTGPDTGDTNAGGGGLVLALLAAACFASSGIFASALQASGWNPAATALVRTAGGALMLAFPAWRALRGRWHLVRRGWATMAVFGVVTIAGGQLCYFHAVQHLSVGLALMIEYLAPVVMVGLTWVMTRRAPGRRTLAGVALSLAGLALILDLAGGARVDVVGVAWALCATAGLVGYFVITGSDDHGLPPLVLAAGGMVVGAATLAALATLGVFPVVWTTAPVVLGGARLPWWTAGLGLAVVASGLAYSLGAVSGRRLGARIASFVGLSEVVLATAMAFLMLGQLPGPLQLTGGALIVVGVVAVKLDAAAA